MEKRTIDKKVLAVVTAIVALVLAVGVLTYTNHKNVNERVLYQKEVLVPALKKLKELDNLLNRSELGYTFWVSIEKPDAPEKKDFLSIMETDYTSLRKEIRKISEKWTTIDKQKLDTTLRVTDTLFSFINENVINKLENIEDYQDPALFFLIWVDREYIYEKFDVIKKETTGLISACEGHIAYNTEASRDNFLNLEIAIVVMIVLLVLCVAAVVFYSRKHS